MEKKFKPISNTKLEIKISVDGHSHNHPFDFLLDFLSLNKRDT
jgi:hypothetical protein